MNKPIYAQIVLESKETINLELIFADLETLDKRLDKAKRNLKADKKYQAEIKNYFSSRYSRFYDSNWWIYN